MPRKVALIRNEGLMDAPLDILLYYWREMPINGGRTCSKLLSSSFSGLNSTLNRSYLTQNQRKTIRNYI